MYRKNRMTITSMHIIVHGSIVALVILLVLFQCNMHTNNNHGLFQRESSNYDHPHPQQQQKQEQRNANKYTILSGVMGYSSTRYYNYVSQPSLSLLSRKARESVGTYPSQRSDQQKRQRQSVFSSSNDNDNDTNTKRNPSETKYKTSITPAKIKTLKSKLNILDILEAESTSSPLQKYTRSSSTQGKACCPFHVERTPSFFIDSNREMFKCFGCGIGGDVFQFVRLMHNENEGDKDMGYYDAVRYVSKKYLSEGECTALGLFAPRRAMSEEERIEKRMVAMNTKASQYYTKQLQDKFIGGKARIYLKQRTITPRTCIDFAMGYAPSSKKGNNNMLVMHLKSFNYTVQEIIASGLGKRRTYGEVKEDEYENLYDRFVDRLMIPIFDPIGNEKDVIAFGGRTLSSVDSSVTVEDVNSTSSFKKFVPPKYINSPESVCFSKKNTLFNHQSQPQPKSYAPSNTNNKKEEVIIVEGYFDVIALHNIGYTRSSKVVSCMGTALSIEQIQLLLSSRRKTRIILCLDNDKAGTEAMVRFCNILATAGNSGSDITSSISDIMDSIYIATIPQYTNKNKKISIKDPFDYISSYQQSSYPNQDIKDKFQKEVVDQVQLWKDWYIQYIFQSYDLPSKHDLDTDINQEQRQNDNFRMVSEKITDFLSHDKIFQNELDRSRYITSIAQRLQPLILKQQNKKQQTSNPVLEQQLQVDLLEMTNRKLRKRTVLEKRIEMQQLKEQREEIDVDLVRTPEQIKKSMYRGSSGANEVTDANIISSVRDTTNNPTQQKQRQRASSSSQQSQRTTSTQQQQDEDDHFSGFHFPNEDYTWLSESSSPPNTNTLSTKQQQKMNFLVYGRPTNQQRRKRGMQPNNELYDYYQNKNVYFNSNADLGPGTSTAITPYQDSSTTIFHDIIQQQKEQQYKTYTLAEQRLLKTLIFYPSTRKLFKALSIQSSLTNDDNGDEDRSNSNNNVLLQWSIAEKEWLFTCMLNNDSNENHEDLERILTVMEHETSSSVGTIDKSFVIMKLRDYFSNRMDVPKGAFYTNPNNQEDEDSPTTTTTTTTPLKEEEPSNKKAMLDEFFIYLLQEQDSSTSSKSTKNEDYEMAQLTLQESFYTMQKCLALQYVSILKNEWKVSNEILYHRLITLKQQDDDDADNDDQLREEEEGDNDEPQKVEDIDFQSDYYNLLLSYKNNNSPTNSDPETRYNTMKISNLKKWSNYIGNKLTTQRQKIQSFQNTIRTLSSNLLQYGHRTYASSKGTSLDKLVNDMDDFISSLPDDDVVLPDTPGDDGFYNFGDDHSDVIHSDYGGRSKDTATTTTATSYDQDWGSNKEEKDDATKKVEEYYNDSWNKKDNINNTPTTNNVFIPNNEDDTTTSSKPYEYNEDDTTTPSKPYDYEAYADKRSSDKNEEWMSKEEEEEMDDILKEVEEEQQEEEYSIYATTNQQEKLESRSPIIPPPSSSSLKRNAYYVDNNGNNDSSTTSTVNYNEQEQLSKDNNGDEQQRSNTATIPNVFNGIFNNNNNDRNKNTNPEEDTTNTPIIPTKNNPTTNEDNLYSSRSNDNMSFTFGDDTSDSSKDVSNTYLEENEKPNNDSTVEDYSYNNDFTSFSFM